MSTQHVREFLCRTTVRWSPRRRRFYIYHLVTSLTRQEYWVRGGDLQRSEFGPTDADKLLQLALRRWENCLEATCDVDQVYAVAADRGGMDFIFSHCVRIPRTDTLINIQMLEAARTNAPSDIHTRRRHLFIRTTDGWC